MTDPRYPTQGPGGEHNDYYGESTGAKRPDPAVIDKRRPSFAEASLPAVQHRFPPATPPEAKRYITREAYMAGKEGVPLPPDTEIPSFEEWHGRAPTREEYGEMTKGIIPECDTERGLLVAERMADLQRRSMPSQRAGVLLAAERMADLQSGHAKPMPTRSIKADPPGRHARVNVQQYDFPSAMDALLHGERISRTAWARGFVVGDFVTIGRIPEFQIITNRDIPLTTRAEDRGREYVTHDRVTLGNALLIRRIATGTWEKYVISDADVFAKDWIIV